VDVEISVEGLIEEFDSLLAAGDFDGAEMILEGALGGAPDLSAFIHYQYGRLYSRWNKLSSAIHHLTLAAEQAHIGGDKLFTIQVVQELKAAKERQLSQRP
jgi:hypothetical protein